MTIEPHQIGCTGKQRIVGGLIGCRNIQILQVRGIRQNDRRQRGTERSLHAEMQFPQVPAARKIQFLQIADIEKLDPEQCITDRSAQHGQRLQVFQIDDFEPGIVTQIERRDGTAS